MHRAVSAGARLIAGEGGRRSGLRALLAFVPSRGRGLLPHGIKARAERDEAPVTRDELAADWGLGNLLAMLDDVGPVQVLLGLPAADRGYLERLRTRHDGVLPEPRFRLATIHATKGREADVVVLVPDMTQATFAHLPGLAR